MAAVIPLSDASRRPTRFPLVTACIIAVNVFFFLLELSLGDAFVTRWAAIPTEIASGHRPVTIVTAMFMHGGWMHIISNMIFLWAFGPELEDLMTRGRYLSFYLLGGLAAMLAQVAANPASTVPTLGASGAIAAVMGAFLVTYPRDKIRSLLVILVFVNVTYIPAMLLIGVWFVIQFLSLGAAGQQSAGGVAYAAHVGGFIFGAVAVRLFEGGARSGGARYP
ncbi:MAG TPA: rhomboid family intramembrane serine protease [Steroidobacteraceae bacterium]|jgi:membrane associated rhomboid family serine protease|nr:rhomboid family intramembrane serine protease [Steroidobacteraceae bacterium]